MKKVRLGKRSDGLERYALVDDEDFETVDAIHWGYTNGYAANSTMNISLHVFLMNPSSGQKIDHIDGDGLNNCRENLRIATSRQNDHNRRPKINKKGKFKGVMWEKDRHKWAARIMVNGTYKNLGRFDNEIDAAIAYDDAARKYFGNFARLNLIDHEGNSR